MALAVLLPLAAQPPEGPPQSGPLKFQSLEPGLDVFQGVIFAVRRSVSMTILRASLRGHRVGLAIPQGKETGDTLVGFLERYKAKAVVSGGFVKSFYPPLPLGLVKQNGQVINRGASADLLNGVLLMQAGRVAIEGFRGTEELTGWGDALQAGPLLVRTRRSALPTDTSGLMPSTRKLIGNEYSRAFVAILPGDQVALAFSGPVTLPALVDFLTRSAAQGGLGCLDALNFTGDRTCGLLVRVGGRELLVGNSYIYLANGVIIR
jgi:hypothetical protein